MTISSADFAIMQARLAPKKTNPTPLDSPHREKDLHAQILGECKRRGWLVFHGSMAHSTFRTPGEPDFVILAQGRTFLIEAKTAKGKLSTAQLAVQAWAGGLGHKVHVVRSFAEFLEAVK